MKFAGWLRVALLGCLLAAGVPPVTAGPNREGSPGSGNALGDYRAETWTTDRGLPQNTIQCLHQSRNGYLWVGTPSGLARFDGVRFTSFDRNNTPEFKSDNILCFSEESDGALWIGTADGVVRLKDHRFTRFSTAELASTDSPTRQVFAVCADSKERVWVGAGGTLALIQEERLTAMTNLESLIESLFKDSAGCLWVGTDKAVICGQAEAHGWACRPIYFGNHNHLFGEHKGAFWFGNEAGLWRYAQGQCSAYTPNSGLAFGLVRSLAEDATEDLWIVAGGHLQRLRGSQFTTVGAETGLPDGSMRSVCSDREGDIWVGTSGSGLVRLHASRFVTYTTRDGVAQDNIRSISEGPDGSVWFGTDNGLSRLSGERFSTFGAPEVPNVFHKNSFKTVLAARSGAVWVGSSEALYSLQGERLECWNPEDYWFFHAIQTLYEDSSGVLWAATEHGLWRLKGRQRDLYNQGAAPEAFPGCTVHTNGPTPAEPLGILEDAQGDLWVGSKSSGLHCFHEGRFTRFTSTNGLTSDYVGPLKADPDGTLWVGSDKGLNRLKHGQITRYTTTQGLAENIVGNLLEDDQGWFWTMGHRGLHRMLKQELVEVAEGKRSTISAITYGTADGMLSSEANVGLFPNACQTADGLLWFPTTRGVLVVEPHLLETRDAPPPAVLEQVLADNEIIYGDEAPNGVQNHLRPGRGRVLEFHFTASTFNSPQQVRFKLKLEGHDAAWHDFGTRRTATYTDLAPGQYVFKVRAISTQGMPSELPAEFAFALAPHFYQTRWFYAAATLGIMLSGGGLHRLRLARLARRQRLEHQLELALQRERIAKDMHDDLGANLTQIGLLSEHARRNAANPGAVAVDIEKIAAATRQTAQAAEEMVWVVSPRHDSLDSLATYLCQFAREYLEPAGIRCRLEVPEQFPGIHVPSEMRHSLVLFVKEALNNAVKHSAASELWLQLGWEQNTFSIRIADDGRGFEAPPAENGGPAAEPVTNGNGLLNLRKRIEALGGSFTLFSRPGQGTQLTARITLGP